MAKIITVSDLNNTKFYQLPKAFFHNPIYIDMKNESKIAYAILKDLLELSIKNNWINEKNEVYVKLSRNKLMTYLNIKGNEKFAKVMKELQKKDLIIYKKIGVNKCNEIYICIPEELDIIYNDETLLEENIPETIENTRRFENRTSRGSKIELPEVRKSNFKRFENRTYTNTNITNTNLTNTNITTTTDTTSSSSTPINDLINEFEENICKLRKTTLLKFKKYISNYDNEFVKIIIEYCAEISINSFAGFKKIIDSYISKNIITKEEFILNIETYRNNKNINANTYKPKNNSFTAYDQRNYTKEQFSAIEQAIMSRVEDVDGEALLKEIQNKNKQQKQGASIY